MPTQHELTILAANEELLTKGNLAVIADFFSTDYIVHAEGKDHAGHAFIKTYITQLRAALPDLAVKDVAILARTGHTVAWQRTLAATHKAALHRIPSSGKKIEWHEMFITRFRGKRIREEWTVSNLAGQLMLKLPRP